MPLTIKDVPDHKAGAVLGFKEHFLHSVQCEICILVSGSSGSVFIAGVHVSLQSSHTYLLISLHRLPPHQRKHILSSIPGLIEKVLVLRFCLSRFVSPGLGLYLHLPDSHCATLGIPAVGHVSRLGEEDEALLARGCDSLCPARRDLAGNTGI